MLNDYMGVVYMSTPFENIRSLTKIRPLASIPVGGSYRIIDFSLSNLINAGVKNVGIFGGAEDLDSLIDHLGNGAEWNLNRKKDGIFIFERMTENLFTTSMKRLKKNIEYFVRSTQKNVIIVSSHMVCNIDMEDVIKNHEKSGKEITVVYKNVNNASEKFDNCDCVKVNKNSEVEGVGQNLFFRDKEKISLEIFVLSKELLIKLICDGIQEGAYFPGRELINRNIPKYRVNGYEFKGYLSCINSTKEYFDFNMDLLNKEVRDDLFGQPRRRIYTKVKDTPPTLYKKGAEINNSLVSNGCILAGKVRNSILARGTIVEEGAVIEDCIILQGTVIRSGAILKNIIADKNNEIKSNERLTASKNYPLVVEKVLQLDKKYFREMLSKLEDVVTD
ncbi:glucose-1-phosphate adenylyltransferase subunit GlgD [Fusobacterium sp. PH5-44]|uniref:glucose-1-phosphate adenylyltransferase subunit GlgD n=1 Tax=unclassified Fusobacterium TaxID=2648384 RepID=UPI003D1ED834